MPSFECSRCGRCCMSLGGVIRIERTLSDADFYCRLLVTQELFLAHVDSAYRDLFQEREGKQAHPGWCPFLRKGNEKYVCTIYQTRPALCREFKCYSMQILHADGELAGRVGGRRSLLSADAALNRIWDEHIAPLKGGSDRDWLLRVKGLLEREGYTVRIFE